MKITRQLLKDYITYPTTKDNLRLEDSTQVYDVVSCDSDTLLITIGDSWTYGLMLTDRSTQTYGKLVSEQLKADWLNISLPGQSNFWMTQRLIEAVNLIKNLDYSKIYIVCAFTEIGRSLVSHVDEFIDYQEWVSSYQGKDIYTDFLEFINVSCINHMNEHAAKDPRITVKIGMTWPDPLGFSTDKNCFEKTWLDVIREHVPMPLDHVCYSAMHGLENLKRAQQFFPNTANFLEWYNDMMDAGTKRLDFMRSYPDHFAYYHPQAHCQQYWADYVVDSLKESK